MTAEQRTLIEAKDLIAIELECSQCRSRIRMPFSKLDPEAFRRRSSSCPNCKDSLCQPPDVNNLADLIGAVRAITADSKSTARIRFELATD